MGLIHFLVKYSLFLLNLVFTIVGIAIVVVGIVILKKFEQIAASNTPELGENVDVETALKLISISIIVLGIIVFLIAFSGCCGAVTETKCLLVTYAVFMFFLITAKIYLTVVWNRDINSLKSATDEFLTNTFDDPTNNVTFHLMEASLQCCGTTGPDSYEGVLSLSVLPPTCCSQEETINYEKECLPEDAFSIGCLEIVGNYFNNVGSTIKKFLIWIIVIEALEFIAAVYLCTSINKNKRRAKYYH